MSTTTHLPYDIIVTDTDNELKASYVAKVQAEVTTKLRAYVKRHYRRVEIKPFDGHCLAFDLEIGQLETGTFDPKDMWTPGYDLMRDAAKFKEAGFGLCDFVLRTEDRVIRGKKRATEKVQILYASFVREVPMKYWLK